MDIAGFKEVVFAISDADVCPALIELVSFVQQMSVFKDIRSELIDTECKLEVGGWKHVLSAALLI